jgi:3',5'-cyclic AMP phosphodiesterase CpdA
MDTFDLIHISDLHFGSDPLEANIFDLLKSQPNAESFGVATNKLGGLLKPGSHNHDIARKLAKLIFNIQQSVSALVITGDLARTGKWSDLSSALNFLTLSPGPASGFLTASGEPTIAGTNLNIFAIPGNHDRYKDDWGNPGSTTFDSVFNSVWSGIPFGISSAKLQHEGGSETLALVAADFCLQSGLDTTGANFITKYGQGRVYSGVLSALTNLTAGFQQQGCGVIWLCHFPPSNKAYNGNELLLNDLDKLIQAAVNLGVKYILAGHIHKSATYPEQSVHVLCAGSGCAYLQTTNSAHRLRFTVDNGNVDLILQSHYRWDAVAKEFF